MNLSVGYYRIGTDVQCTVGIMGRFKPSQLSTRRLQQQVASYPGRVVSKITLGRQSRPGIDCLRMHQLVPRIWGHRITTYMLSKMMT